MNVMVWLMQDICSSWRIPHKAEFPLRMYCIRAFLSPASLGLAENLGTIVSHFHWLKSININATSLQWFIVVIKNSKPNGDKRAVILHIAVRNLHDVNTGTILRMYFIVYLFSSSSFSSPPG